MFVLMILLFLGIVKGETGDGSFVPLWGETGDGSSFRSDISEQETVP